MKEERVTRRDRKGVALGDEQHLAKDQKNKKNKSLEEKKENSRCLGQDISDKVEGKGGGIAV